MVTVFSKNNCYSCKMTKRWLEEHDIDFVEVNTDDDLSALNFLIENNLRTLPVVMIEDELLTMGFAPNKLKELL